jgi:hypothetical protein
MTPVKGLLNRAIPATMLSVSIIILTYVLATSFGVIPSLSADLFEMFRPLGPAYFIAGLLIALSIYNMFMRTMDGCRISSAFTALMVTAILLYKVLPKYTYTLPLQREIYHTANIMYIYDYHTVGTPETYPSMYDSIGYAIFYATLGLVLGLDRLSFVTFLGMFTDIFHMFIITLLGYAVIMRRMNDFSGFSARRLLIPLIPIIFMLQISTTYRNGFAAILMAYIIVLLCRIVREKTYNLTVTLMLLFFTAAVSYPALIPLITISTFVYLLIQVFAHKSARGNLPSYLILGANVAWFGWELNRYPNIFSCLYLYMQSLSDMLKGNPEFAWLTGRLTIYNPQYNMLLMVRMVYAFALLAAIGLLAMVKLFTALKIKDENYYNLVSVAFAMTFIGFIFIGFNRNFHFAAIYHIFLFSSGVLLSDLMFQKSSTSPINEKPNKKKTCWLVTRVWNIILVSFCISIMLSPIALWPAFKNLMPIEVKEVNIFEYLANFAKNDITMGYLGLYGDTMGTSIQYVFATRTDVRMCGMAYPTEGLPNYEYTMVASNIISTESKASFSEPLDEWLSGYLINLYNSERFNKVLDFGGRYEVLTDNSRAI